MAFLEWLKSLFSRPTPKPTPDSPPVLNDFPWVAAPESKPERKSDSPMTLGIRGNNPGNLRKSDIAWLGEVADNNTDFEKFDTATDGIRALAKNLLAYQDRHGLRTVAAIVSRWAPHSENDTDAYIKAVASDMRIDPQATINLHEPQTLADLTRAIIRHENGQQPYTDQTINESVQLALA